jgi:hypothetical protein
MNEGRGTKDQEETYTSRVCGPLPIFVNAMEG